ncbi:MAG TPA: hypothetical protein VN962_27230 [Polyangia bacterium]|nr:hypothetical protein [Polyangia bacterium]
MITALLTGAPLIGCGEMPGDQAAATTANESAGLASLSTSQRTTLINNKFNQNTALLGSPISGSLVQFSNGAKEDFTGAGSNSSIYLGDSVDVAFIVMGFIRGDYLSQGAQSGVLGYPVSDEGNTSFGTGRFSQFQHGRSLWKNGASAAFSTHNRIDDYYITVGMEWGNLGYPQSDEYAFGSQRKNDFEFGKIYYNGTSRGVITASNTNSKLSTQSWPRLTRATIAATQSGGCINVAGAGFPANVLVSFQTNDPSGHRPSNGSTVTGSDGTFTFDESLVNNGQNCTTGIFRINGLATIEAHGGGATAILGVSTTAGSPYPGSL